MRVLYIYDGDWPVGATRVRKQTLALYEAGHQVLLLSRNETRAPRVQHEYWMEVRRLPTLPGGAANRIGNFPLFINPLWILHIRSNAARWGADAIVVEDLPLAPTALGIGRLLRIPVFYDMGEVYPEFLRGLWTFGRPSLLDRVIRNPAGAALIERFVLRRASHVFVVSEESRARAIALGADENRTTIVGNTPEDHQGLLKVQPPPTELAFLHDRPIVLFTGILIFDRGIRNAIHAIEHVRKRIPKVAFVIVGDGPDAAHLRREIEQLRLQDHVFMLGWKEHSRLPAYYHAAVVGLLPFLDGGQIRYTLANKLFDYMGAGLPVIASDVPPMRRIISETHAGLLVPSGDPEALGDAIITLLEMDTTQRAEIGKRGQKAVADVYHWSVDATRFTQALTAVQHRASSSRVPS